jgi:hypothetical protein
MRIAKDSAAVKDQSGKRRAEGKHQDDSTEPKRRNVEKSENAPSTAASEPNVEKLTLDMVRNRETVAIPIIEHQRVAATNWKSYKEFESCSSNEMRASLVSINDLVDDNFGAYAFSRNLFSGKASPVVHPFRAYESSDLYGRLKSKGPRNNLSVITSATPKIDFQLFLASNGQPNYDKPDAFVVVANSETDERLNLDEIVHLNTSIRSSGAFLLYAVLEESTVAFFKLTPFELWDETPERWTELQ